jgi:hypothetical protein
MIPQKSQLTTNNRPKTQNKQQTFGDAEILYLGKGKG